MTTCDVEHVFGMVHSKKLDRHTLTIRPQHRMEIHCLFCCLLLASITNDQLLINQSFSLYRQVQSFYTFIIGDEYEEKMMRNDASHRRGRSHRCAQPSLYPRNSLNNCSENILLRFVCGPINWFVSRFMHQFEEEKNIIHLEWFHFVIR